MKKIFCCTVSVVLIFFSLIGFGACAHAGTGTAYDLVFEYVPTDSKLYGEMNLTYCNTTQNTIEELKFQLYPNAYREGAAFQPVSPLYTSAAYYEGASYGKIEINDVTGCASYGVGGEDCNILFVKLGEPLYPDETYRLCVKFEVTLAHVNHRLGIGSRTVNLAGCYPVLCAYRNGGFEELVYAANGDPFVSECADYTVSLTAPSEYQIVSGMAGKVTTQGGSSTFRGSAKNVRDVAFVLGKTLNCLTAETKGTQVEYWYVDDEDPQAALNTALESLAFYSETFGAYEYPRYAVVQTDFPYGGMEYTALSLISAKLQKREIPSVIAHETAHQWWYAMVGSDQFQCAWQDEGLAEYSTALFLDAHSAYGDSYAAFVGRCESSYRAYFSVRTQMTGKVDTSMNRPLTSYTGEYEYRNLAYDKGVILFDRVRSVLGDKRFFSALKEYRNNYIGKIASYGQLIECFSGSGLDVEGIFASFLDGTCVI